MDHMWARVGSQLVARVRANEVQTRTAQPAISAFFAIRCGLADTKCGNPPYFWALLWHRGHRSYMIKEAGNTSEGFSFSLLMDVVYQIIVLRFVYQGKRSSSRSSGDHPYLILRGLVMLNEGVPGRKTRCWGWPVYPLEARTPGAERTRKAFSLPRSKCPGPLKGIDDQALKNRSLFASWL